MEKQTLTRCAWCGQDALYREYHDSEWGKVVHDDQTLFEFLILESAQAGLSWITILRKRENYRRLFADFDATRVANFTPADVDRILQDPGIIRNRLKVQSSISNAQIFLRIQKEYGSFYTYLYSFMPNNGPRINRFVQQSDIPVATKESDALSKDLKKRGIKFFGTTICYAYMQAVGMVNDHILTCSFR